MHDAYIYYLFLLKVKFIGEEAVDEGGPKKEFWRLLGEAIRKEMCAGDNEKLCLEHDVIGLQVNIIIISM